MIRTILLVAFAAFSAVPSLAAEGISVRDFSAVGDNITDDTAAFRKALDSCSQSLGGVVSVPTGNYLIKGHLNIPSFVTLEGVFKAPTARSKHRGTTLSVVEGKGKAGGEPFITLNADSVLKGVTIFYPEQDATAPVEYPWCVRGIGDNCTVLDVLMINPWNAVDFGTYPCGRHLIRGLYGQSLRTGIFVDQCLDVGRIEDVHF